MVTLNCKGLHDENRHKCEKSGIRCFMVLKVCMANIHTDVQSLDFDALWFCKSLHDENPHRCAKSLDFGALGFSKVCMAKIHADAQSLNQSLYG